MKRVVTIFLVVTFTMVVFGCSKQTEEDQVKKVIADIQTAGEEKDVKTIRQNLSMSYRDPQGFDYEGIHRLLAGYFFRYPKIKVYIRDLDVSVLDTEANAVFQAVLTSAEKTGSLTDVIPQSLGVWNFDVSLKKEDNDWKVTSARWQEASIMKSEQ